MREKRERESEREKERERERERETIPLYTLLKLYVAKVVLMKTPYQRAWGSNLTLS